jgi:uncharacterized protein YigE (DUF2233 family)
MALRFKKWLVTSRALLWLFPLPGILTAVSVDSAVPRNPFRWAARAHEQSSTNASLPARCGLVSADAVSLRCTEFEGHVYAVADVDLRSHEIVFTTSADGARKTYPEIVSELSRKGMNPLLVTNAGIYGTDNRPLGLLISFHKKLHGVNRIAGHGNFAWDSGVFQVLEDDTASIVPAVNWQESPGIAAATQSGPQLVKMGKINESFSRESKWSFSRTAVGVDQSSRRLVHVVVSRDGVTLFELARFMVNELHSSEALHLDGNLSALYLPSAEGKYVFEDPGARIVTALSVIEKKAK